MAGYINTAQLRRDHNGQRNTCAACGHPGNSADPLIKALDGYRIHRSHTTDPRSGYYRQQQKG